MGNISDHFLLQEFVPKEIFNDFKEKSIWFIDQRIVTLAEFIRSYFGAQVIINDWVYSGHFNERGYRLPWSKTGGSLSQHKLGRAIDINVKGMDPHDVFKQIQQDYIPFKSRGLTTMEDPDKTPGWTHLDVRWTGLETLLIVDP